MYKLSVLIRKLKLVTLNQTGQIIKIGHLQQVHQYYFLKVNQPTYGYEVLTLSSEVKLWTLELIICRILSSQASASEHIAYHTLEN